MRIKFAIGFVLIFSLFFIACSKEDEKEVTPYPYTPPSYDVGYLMVKITNNPSIVDSIKYTNLTKGTTNHIEKSELTYYSSNNYSVLSKAIANGNTNDQVSCCVYLNQATNIGIEFEYMSIDSINTTFTNSSIYCLPGTY